VPASDGAARDYSARRTPAARGHGPQMTLVDDDQEFQTLSAQCADDALGDGVRLRRVHGREDRLDADLGGPWDEAATIATIAVPNQITRLLSPRSRRQKLAPDPFSRRMGGDVDNEPDGDGRD
jgi:hypothetical protein